MTTALAVLAVLLAVAVGGFPAWCLLHGRWPKRRGLESLLCLSLAFPLGAGAISLLHFVLMPLGLFSPWLSTLPALGLAGMAWPLRRCWRNPEPPSPEVEAAQQEPVFPWRWALVLTGGAVLAALFFAALSIAKESPHGAWDSWAIWTLRAKFLAGGESFWRNALDPGFRLSHPEYPLLTSSFIAWGWGLAGTETTLLPRMVAPFFFLSMAGIVGSSLSLLRGASQGLLGLIAVLSPAAMVSVSAALYADVPLAAQLAAASALLLLAFAAPRGEAFALLAGIAAGFCAWTKLEGLIHLTALAVGVVAIGFRTWNEGTSARTRLLAFAAGALPGAFFISCFRLFLAPVGVQGLVPVDGLTRLFGFERFLDILRTGAEMVFAMGPLWVHPLWFVVLPLAVLGFRGWGRLGAGFFALGLAWVVLCAGYFAVYLLGTADVAPMMTTSFDRLMLHPWPMLVMLALAAARSPEDHAVAIEAKPSKQERKRQARRNPYNQAMRVLAFAVLASLCTVSVAHAAEAPFETGTVIVVAYSKQRIVVAADSRASFMKEGFQDEVCKVANPARNVLFAASGMVGAGDWSAGDIAREVAQRHVGGNPYLSGSTLQSIAESWARTMAGHIRALPADAVLRYRNESRTSAVFAGLDRADEINMVQVQLQPVAAAGGLDVRSQISAVEIYADGTRYLVMGRPQVAMEFLRRSSQRAQAEVAKWPEYFQGAADLDEQVALRLVELTGYFDPRKDLVGGSTSALRMDGKGGVRWLQRPPSCY